MSRSMLNPTSHSLLCKLMVLTCVSIAGGGWGREGSPGRYEEEQEAQKHWDCRIGPVAFPEKENTHM